MEIDTILYKTTIHLSPDKLRNNLSHVIQEKFHQNFEGRYLTNIGYILPNRSSIEERTNGYYQAGHFTGSLTFDVTFKIHRIYPKSGDIAKGVIWKKNESSIICTIEKNGIMIYVQIGKDYQSLPELYKTHYEDKIGKEVWIIIENISSDDMDQFLIVTGSFCNEPTQETQQTSLPDPFITGAIPWLVSRLYFKIDGELDSETLPCPNLEVENCRNKNAMFQCLRKYRNQIHIKQLGKPTMFYCSNGNLIKVTNRQGQEIIKKEWRAWMDQNGFLSSYKQGPEEQSEYNFLGSYLKNLYNEILM